MGGSSVQVTFALSYFCCIPFLQNGGTKLTSWQTDTIQSLTYWILSDGLAKVLIIKKLGWFNIFKRSCVIISWSVSRFKTTGKNRFLSIALLCLFVLKLLFYKTLLLFEVIYAIYMYSGKRYLKPYIKLSNWNIKKNAQESISLLNVFKGSFW